MLNEIKVNDEIHFNVNGFDIYYTVERTAIGYFLKDLSNDHYGNQEIFRRLNIINIVKFSNDCYEHESLHVIGIVLFPYAKDLDALLRIVNRIYELIDELN